MAEYTGGASRGWVPERFLKQRRWMPDLTVGTESSNVISVVVQMRTFEATGNEYVDADESVALLCTLIDSQGQLVERGTLKTAVIAGGAAGPLTVTGIAALDQLVSVVRFIGAGTDVTDVSDLTSEFSISAANTITNVGGTATTGDKLLVVYRDRTLFHLAETGAGTAVTGTTRATLLVTTSAAGAATIAVTDVAGASGATVYLKVEPLNKPGYPAYAVVTFD